MSVLQTLWLPILLSAVFVFFVSSLLHMLPLPWHKFDYKPLPDEEKFAELIRAQNVSDGDYMLPYCRSGKQRSAPEFQARLARGPIGLLTITGGGAMMGRSLALWSIYVVVISYFAAYVAAHALAPTALLSVHARPLRFTFLAAFLGYGGALWQGYIWYRRPFGSTFRNTIDAVIYAAVTAATFNWLWPKL